MTSFRTLLAASAAAFILTVSAFAADPSGTWKWTSTGPNGQSFESTLKLEVKDGKLTGTVTGPRGDNAISDASVTDDDVKFNVERERNGNKFVIKYDGKLDGDSIKGTIVMPGRDGGEPRKMDWSAQRAK